MGVSPGLSHWGEGKAVARGELVSWKISHGSNSLSTTSQDGAQTVTDQGGQGPPLDWELEVHVLGPLFKLWSHFRIPKGLGGSLAAFVPLPNEVVLNESSFLAFHFRLGSFIWFIEDDGRTWFETLAVTPKFHPDEQQMRLSSSLHTCAHACRCKDKKNYHPMEHSKTKTNLAVGKYYFQ